MIELPLQHLQRSKREDKYLVLKNLIKPPIGWDEVWLDYHYSIEQDLLIKRREHGFVTHHAHISIPQVKDLCNEFAKQLRVVPDAHVYAAFSRHDNGSGKHKDTMDVIYIQCVGITMWEVDSDTHILNPGDAIFIPKDKYHHVNSLTARVGLSLGVS